MHWRPFGLSTLWTQPILTRDCPSGPAEVEGAQLRLSSMRPTLSRLLSLRLLRAFDSRLSRLYSYRLRR